jgi:hypothetical protein
MMTIRWSDGRPRPFIPNQSKRSPDSKMGLKKQLVYGRKVFPSATWRALQSPARGPVHVIFVLADHFEPAIDPEDGQKRVSRSEQERRMEWWAREYPKVVDGWRDHDGRPLVHTYFYPAEQYDEGLVEMLADHCHAGWGEVEVHLHHGFRIPTPPKTLAACSPNSATGWPFAIAASPQKKVPIVLAMLLCTEISRSPTRLPDAFAASIRKCRFLPRPAVMPT